MRLNGKTNQYIRWMIKQDADRVLEIEHASFASPWTMNDLVAVLHGRSTIGIVVEAHDTVAGFAIYDLGTTGIHMLNLAVDPAYRKRGVGRRMICHLARKLTGKRRVLRAYVSERNLGAQLFFRQCGFRATSIEHGAYGVPDHDAYRMDYAAVTFGDRLTSTTMKGL